jgi:hypothetical protein
MGSLVSSIIGRGGGYLAMLALARPYREVVLKLFGLRRTVKYIKKNFLAHFVYKIKNILIYFKLWIKIFIEIGFFSFLKYPFIMLATHLATSCRAPFESYWYIVF